MANIERSFYSIREVSEQLNVPIPTLRYWEQQIPDLKPTKNEGGTRFYSPHDVEIVKKIKFLRDNSVPVSDVSRRLRLDARGVDTRTKARENLLEMRAALENLRDMI